MNKQKKFLVRTLTIIIFISVIFAFNNRRAENVKNNKYIIESSTQSLKLDDEFSITLVVECNEPTDSMQGRIEYSDDVEIVGDKFYDFEEFTEKETMSGESITNVALGANNAIGFAVARQAKADGSKNTVTGTKKIITFKFKVKSSLEKNVEIKWKGKNKEGLYDITSITIPRADIKDEENKNPTNNIPIGTQTKNDAVIENSSVIKEEKTSEKVTENKNDKNGKNTIPQTGENYMFIILGTSIIVIAFILWKKCKKSKF